MKKCFHLVVLFKQGKGKSFYGIFTKLQKLCLHKTKKVSFWTHQTLSLFLFKKEIFSPQEMFISCLCLRYGADLNGILILFAYLLIILLGQDWFDLRMH